MFNPPLTPAEIEIIVSYTFWPHYIRKKSTVTSWTGYRVGPTFGAGVFKKTKAPRICPISRDDPSVVQPVA
jgi:hypothetical protein